jgi:localization factor PodJL
MKSGGRWNFRGLRSDAAAAGRDTARRSGMSVGEWLNSVAEPTEAEDDERRWSADAEDEAADRSVRRRKERFRDHEAPPRPDRSGRRRDEASDEPRDDHPRYGDDRRYHNGRSFVRDSEPTPRRRDDEPDEPQWQARAGEGERGLRRRDRKHRFHDRAAEESRRQSFSGDDESDDRYGDRRERPRQPERADEAEWAARHQDRESRRRLAAPAADRGPGFDHNPGPDARPRDLPKSWDADTEWQRATRASAPTGDASPLERNGHHDAQREQNHYAAQQEQDRRLRDHQVRLERQRRERELFERAAAEAVAEQRRQSVIDQAVAEIAARQQALDRERAIENARQSARSAGAYADAAPMRREAPPQAPAESERIYAPWPEGWRSQAAAEATEVSASEPLRAAFATPAAAPEPAIDISGLQEQLREMTARIEALRPSSDLEKAITGLRTDLAEVSRSFTEALPRRALEALEIEVKALGQRIDSSRQTDTDSAALTGIERGLAEVREALRGLTPVEGLAGFDGALKAISSKVEAIGTKDDPAALQQLESAMDALRGMIARVASEEALTKVAQDVRALSVKVDHVTGSPSNAPTLVALENRIDILASALNASTEAGHAVPRELEKLLSGLLEKLEWVQLTHTDRTALSHLEDRIAALVKRLDTSDTRLGLLEGVERGLADLLVYIEQLRGAGAAAPAAQPSAIAAPVERADAVIREKERFKPAERLQQSEQVGPTERAGPSEQFKQTEQFAGLSLHDDLFDDGQATSEVRAERAQGLAPAGQAERSNVGSAPPLLPGPVATLGPSAQFANHREHADFAAADAIAAETTARLGQIDPIDAALGRPTAARSPIDPNLPPDHPLEPGSTSRSRGASPLSEHVTPSDIGSGTKPPVIADPGAGKSDFIAAARRAAQAASVGATPGKNAAPAGGRQPKKFSDRLRTLAVAAAVVVIVVGGFHIISRLFDDASGSATRIDAPPASSPSQTEPPPTQSAPQPEAPVRKEPPHVQAEPIPPGAANLLSPVPLFGGEGDKTSADAGETTGSISSPAQALGRRDGKADNRAPEAALPAPGMPMDITGALPNAAPPARSPAPQAPPAGAAIADRLPAAIGGPTLRLAAIAGDPLAAYEVGVRFSEGKGVPPSNEEAAHWFEIAAKKGIVPAQFRLGTLYEKGLGVKKDLIAARNLYRAAADRGHAKAMHNLAVIYAEGPDGKPDYVSAAQWFRKAADYGVADSQYNLAILYARGVGVEQNLAESYKWFFLAAREGDQDAAQKRDEIASRIDRTALAAARAAAESWKAIPQPADAITVKGAWDPPPGPQPPAKPKPRSAKAAPRDISRVN